MTRNPLFVVTKTYGHAQGLSVCFRQWRAESHCKFMHGYAVAVELKFKARELDERGWVIDFGGLAAIKQFLADTFDHKTLVAFDDPLYHIFEHLHEAGGIQIIGVQRVGCESFAELVGEFVVKWLAEQLQYAGRVTLMSCTIKEHDGNSATYAPGV